MDSAVLGRPDVDTTPGDAVFVSYSRADGHFANGWRLPGGRATAPSGSTA